MDIISLFSGAGGLDLGFVQAGHNIVWANDIDEDAVATYRKNIGSEIVNADIREVDIDSLPPCDVVIGGFPCQGFSMANLKRSVDDSRNELYKFYCQVVRRKKPLLFFAENVRGILSLGKGKVIEKIIGDFQEIGYDVSVHKVNMADYGVPQIRQRVIIVGQRKDVPLNRRFVFPRPTNSNTGAGLFGLAPWVSIRDAIEHFPDPDGPNNVPNHVYSSYKVVYRNFTAHRPTDPDKPSPTVLARGNGKGGVCAIPHYNGKRRLSVRESAAVQTFPDDFVFIGSMSSCYRQIGNAVPPLFSKALGVELKRYEERLERRSKVEMKKERDGGSVAV